MPIESHFAQASAWTDLAAAWRLRDGGLPELLGALARAEDDYARAGLPEAAQALRETRLLAAAAFAARIRRLEGSALPS